MKGRDGDPGLPGMEGDDGEPGRPGGRGWCLTERALQNVLITANRSVTFE